MAITFKQQSRNKIVSNDVVFSTVQIEQSQFVTLPPSITAGPRFIIRAVEKRNVPQEQQEEPNETS